MSCDEKPSINFNPVKAEPRPLGPARPGPLLITHHSHIQPFTAPGLPHINVKPGPPGSLVSTGLYRSVTEDLRGEVFLVSRPRRVFIFVLFYDNQTAGLTTRHMMSLPTSTHTVHAHTHTHSHQTAAHCATRSLGSSSLHLLRNKPGSRRVQSSGCIANTLPASSQ